MIICKHSVSTELQSQILRHPLQQQIMHPTPSPIPNHRHHVPPLWIYRRQCPPIATDLIPAVRPKFPPLRNQPALVPPAPSPTSTSPSWILTLTLTLLEDNNCPAAFPPRFSPPALYNVPLPTTAISALLSASHCHFFILCNNVLAEMTELP